MKFADVGRSMALAAVAASLLACGKPKQPPPAPPPPPDLNNRVTVLAADILVIDGVHVRLSNVFGPEGIPNARCWAEALAAREAGRALREMVISGREIAYTPTGGRDSYNRVYAQVNLDGLDLGETLFNEGLVAKPQKKGRFDWCGPLSEATDGPPPLRTLMGLGPRR